jgi:hypothetical protein
MIQRFYGECMNDKVNWPTFFIVGAVKCGTTSLYEHLKKHPQVFLPEVKEPHFFASFQPPPVEDLGEHCNGDIEHYRRLYRGAQGSLAIGDASPSYLWDEAAPRRIYEVCPQARIIIMLRDPVARAHSHFLMDAARLGNSSFGEAVRQDYSNPRKGWWVSHLYVELGLYHDQVRRYLEIFGKEQVYVGLFKDLVENPRALLSKLSLHIGIDEKPFDAMSLDQPHNPFKMPRSVLAYKIAKKILPTAKLRRRMLPERVREWLATSGVLYAKARPSLDDEARSFLQRIYEPEVARLEELLKRRLPELRESWLK